LVQPFPVVIRVPVDRAVRLADFPVLAHRHRVVQTAPVRALRRAIGAFKLSGQPGTITVPGGGIDPIRINLGREDRQVAKTEAVFLGSLLQDAPERAAAVLLERGAHGCPRVSKVAIVRTRFSLRRGSDVCARQRRKAASTCNVGGFCDLASGILCHQSAYQRAPLAGYPHVYPRRPQALTGAAKVLISLESCPGWGGEPPQFKTGEMIYPYANAQK
jgi:hypothetical protein